MEEEKRIKLPERLWGDDLRKDFKNSYLLLTILDMIIKKQGYVEYIEGKIFEGG